MMNRSKIDYCDFSWNPVTGCRHTCEYCYARKQARRFSGDVRLNLGSNQLQHDEERDLYTLQKPFKNGNGATVPFPTGFSPTLHEYRLPMPAQKKKPANIFVCSMADLFGDWVPEKWILQVFEACEAAPQHNYLFLTKNPSRYSQLAKEKKLPRNDNFWYGSTVDRKGCRIFDGSIHWNTFVSIEPLLEPLDVGLGSFGAIDWVIVGAETGNRHDKVTPKREWIENVVEAAGITHAPVFMKDSKEMRSVWGDDLIRDMPPQLEHEEDPEIPHCKQCDFCFTEPDGDRGTRSYCGMMYKKHIFGRYMRTSPLWCPARKKGDTKNE